MTTATARVDLVHLINLDSMAGGCQPSDKANQLGLRVCPQVAVIHTRNHLLLLLSQTGVYSFYSISWQKVDGPSRNKHKFPKWNLTLVSLTPPSCMLPLGHVNLNVQ